MLTVQDLHFQYPDVPLFKGFNWQALQGEAWSILGPSGCGKTSFLYLLSGLLHPSKGHVLVHGDIILRPRPRTGLILQDYGLLPWATIEQNVSLGLNVRSFYGPDGLHAPATEISTDNGEQVTYWMNRLSLDHIAHHYPNQISGGQRQRAAIARTLVLGPDLLLMDEPFASLDAPSREALQDLIIELHHEQQMTIVAVTHTIEEAALLGQKVLILGQPPHASPLTHMNPNAGRSAYRGSREFLSTCTKLREMLEPSV
jgi:NitT/TauT family transport system ATP-binding protein